MVTVHVGPAVETAALDRVGVTFADGAYAVASVLDDTRRAPVLAVEAYETRAGSVLEAALWSIRDVEVGDDARRLRLGARLPA